MLCRFKDFATLIVIEYLIKYSHILIKRDSEVRGHAACQRVHLLINNACVFPLRWEAVQVFMGRLWMALCTERWAYQTLQEAHWSKAIQMQSLRQVSVRNGRAAGRWGHVMSGRVTPFITLTNKSAASLHRGAERCPTNKDPMCRCKWHVRWREDCGSRVDWWNEVKVNELDERRRGRAVRADRAGEVKPECVLMRDAARRGSSWDSCYQAKTTALPPSLMAKRIDTYRPRGWSGHRLSFNQDPTLRKSKAFIF